MKDAELVLADQQKFLADTQAYRVTLEADLNDKVQIQERAAKKLAAAEEAKAKKEMEKQAAEFAAFQTEYNTLKGRYDTLMGKWDETGALSSEEQQEVGELEQKYLEDKETFDNMEKNRVAKERENLQKELNKFKMNFDDATKDLKKAQAEFERQGKANTQAGADVTKYETAIAKLEQQIGKMTTDADISAARSKINEQTGKMI